MNGFAAHLKAEHGSKLHLYCATERDAAQYRRTGIFDTVTRSEIWRDALFQPGLDDTAVFDRALELENYTGTRINTLAVSNRHVGRSYALGGFRHPRSRLSEDTSYAQMVHAFNESLSFWRDELHGKGITLFLNPSKEAGLMASAAGIPRRVFSSARYKDYYYWSPNEFMENPDVEPRFHAATGTASHDDLANPYFAHLLERKRFVDQNSIFQLAKRLAMTVARYTYWRARGYEKGRSYYVSDTLGYLIRQYRDTRRMTGPETVTLEQLSGRPFVFYPLHTEPEAALQGLSPEYFFQLSTIAALSRDLPAGVTLAVKETIAGVGRRPAQFYDQILAFKNVRMLKMFELGIEVARKSSAVATITGTAGFEGAVMGKPIIAFGRHNTYNFLPHVHAVTDVGRLAETMQAIFAGGFDSAKAASDGAKFLECMKELSFDLEGYDYRNNPKGYKPSALIGAYKNLLGSLVAGESGGSSAEMPVAAGSRQ